MRIDTEFKFKDEKTNLTLANWKDVVCCYSNSLDSLVTLSVIKDIAKGEKKSISYKQFTPLMAEMIGR